MPDRRLMVFGGNANPELTRSVCSYLQQPLGKAALSRFSDGETALEIQENVRLHIGCAGDPVGAIGLARGCEAIGLPIDVISGPVTDNEVGKSIVKNELDVLVYNAFNPSTEWIDLVISRWLHAYQLSA